MQVRFLETTDAAALRARYAGLSAADAQRLAAGAEARVLVVDPPLSQPARDALQAAGAVLAADGPTLLLALTRAQALAARDRAPAELDLLLAALDRAREPAPVLRLRERVLDLSDQAQVMGIVNVTPDSFYQRVDGVAAALEKARGIAADGAALIDLGGQSYAHWNARVAPEAERERVVPAVRALVAAQLDVAISVDTFTAGVADAALAAGAHLINDCSGLSDPALAPVVAAHGAGLVVMHLRGELNLRQPERYVYRDALAEIVEFLYARTEHALACGVSRDAIAIDPGLEFGKEPATDLEILERFGELRALGYPILFASSRKSFIGRIFGRPAAELLVPSLATAALGLAAGARLLRVHDVAETVQLARMLAAVRPERRAALPLAAAMPGTPLPGNPADSPAV